MKVRPAGQHDITAAAVPDRQLGHSAVLLGISMSLFGSMAVLMGISVLHLVG